MWNFINIKNSIFAVYMFPSSFPYIPKNLKTVGKIW